MTLDELLELAFPLGDGADIEAAIASAPNLSHEEMINRALQILGIANPLAQRNYGIEEIKGLVQKIPKETFKATLKDPTERYNLIRKMYGLDQIKKGR